MSEIVASSQGAAAMDKLGVEADTNSPEAFATLYQATWERYRDVVKSTGFKAED